MKHLLLVVCMFTCYLTTECRADVVYKFSYTAQTGLVHSFSFSFTAPTFVTVGSSPVFTPFTVTDGTNSWTMTQDLVQLDALNRGCFQFGTSAAQLSPPGPPAFGGPCSITAGGAGAAYLEFNTSGGLPTAAGVYVPEHFAGAFITATAVENIQPITDTFSPTGTMSLEISLSSVKEEHFNTKLSGFVETPPNLTNGTGTFSASLESGATSLSFTLKYSDLSGTATQAHIHFAQPGVPGSIIVFLCSGPKPACPASSGTVTGTITAADVLAVSSQGVTAGSFADLLKILRSGDAYVNVHTTTHPAGEIRGQLGKADEE